MKIYSFKEQEILKYSTLLEAIGVDFDKDKIITVVGAGGKTSTVFKLGEELSRLNKKVIITTTTHMRLDEDFILVDTESDFEKVKSNLMCKNLIKIAKKESKYKVKSIDFDILKKIIDVADFVLIEGDGSKNLPLKVPREDEPVIIDETNLVLAVMGFEAIDKSIDKICHRKELVSEFLGKNLEDKIDYKDLFKIASSEKGLRKNVNCKYKVIVNKVDREEDLSTCKKIHDLLSKENIEVIFTSYRG